MTTMRIPLPSDPTEIEFVAGRTRTPEHSVRCRVGSKLRTGVTWDGSRLTCEAR